MGVLARFKRVLSVVALLQGPAAIAEPLPAFDTWSVAKVFEVTVGGYVDIPLVKADEPALLHVKFYPLLPALGTVGTLVRADGSKFPVELLGSNGRPSSFAVSLDCAERVSADMFCRKFRLKAGENVRLRTNPKDPPGQ